MMFVPFKTLAKCFSHFAICILAIAALLDVECHADLLALEYDSLRILRLDETTGAEVGVFADLNSEIHQSPYDMTFGPDGHLYVADAGGSRILRYNGVSGDFMGVLTGTPGLPDSLTFDSNGDLYVSTFHEIIKYDGKTGTFINTLVPGVHEQYYKQLRIGPDGNLYAVYLNEGTPDLVRMNPTTGELIDTFVAGYTFDGPTDFTFGPDDELYIANWHRTELFRYSGSMPTSLDDLESLIDGPPFINLDVILYARDGSLLAMDVSDGNIDNWRIRRLDPATGELLQEFPKGAYAAIVQASVPEPSSWACLLLSTGAVVARRHRRAASMRFQVI